MDVHRSRVLWHILESAGREDELLQKLLTLRLETQHLPLMSPDEVEKTDLSLNELQPYLSVLGVTEGELLQGISQERVLEKALPMIEGHILRTYERVLRVIPSPYPVKFVQEIVSRIESTRQKTLETRSKQLEIASLGVTFLQSALQSYSDSDHFHSDSPSDLLKLRVHVLSLHRQCLTQSLLKDLYSPQARAALKVIRMELDKRVETVRDRLAMEKDRLERFTMNPKLRQVSEEYRRVKREIQEKRSDLEKLIGGT